jgi:hypothetical protein
MVKSVVRIAGVSSVVVGCVLALAVTASAAPARAQAHPVAARIHVGVANGRAQVLPEVDITANKKGLKAKYTPKKIKAPGLWDGIQADCGAAQASFELVNDSVATQTITADGSDLGPLPSGYGEYLCVVPGAGRITFGLEGSTKTLKADFT